MSARREAGVAEIFVFLDLEGTLGTLRVSTIDRTLTMSEA